VLDWKDQGTGVNATRSASVFPSCGAQGTAEVADRQRLSSSRRVVFVVCLRAETAMIWSGVAWITITLVLRVYVAGGSQCPAPVLQSGCRTGDS